MKCGGTILIVIGKSMSDNEITSIGIDIGTTTTQVIVSVLTIGTTSHDDAGKLVVTDREVLHRGGIHRTQLLDSETVDIDATASIIEEELAEAEVTPTDVDTGAVIITGEAARKENAELLIHRLAVESGEFVTATAGAALEAILAGRGAGTAVRATKMGKTIANVDIGGGTTNIATFEPAGVCDTRCINVGGRLVEFDGENNVTKVSKPAQDLAEEFGLEINTGESYDRDEFQQLTAAMAERIVDAMTGPPFTDRTHTLTIGSLPTESVQLDEVVFTGGVGQLVNIPIEEHKRFEYGDIGSLLAADVRERTGDLPLLQLNEDVRATVIGVGTQTTRLSGRTLMIDESLLPLRNLPVIGIRDLRDIDRGALSDRFSEAVSVAKKRYGSGEPFVLSLRSLTYQHIKEVAKAIAAAYENVDEEIPSVVLTQQNCAKALGQTLDNYLSGRPVMTIDEIEADEGDYLDIGSPLADSDTVPVVVKTLAFGK